MLPFTALNSASVTGPGPTSDLEGVCKDFTIVVTATGDPTSVGVTLQGSHDEQTWFGIASVGLGLFTPVQDHYARYVRANLQSLSGGTVPTVTATIAPGKVDKS